PISLLVPYASDCPVGLFVGTGSRFQQAVQASFETPCVVANLLSAGELGLEAPVRSPRMGKIYHLCLPFLCAGRYWPAGLPYVSRTTAAGRPVVTLCLCQDDLYCGSRST